MHKGCAHWSRSIRDPNQKNSDEKTGASYVSPKYKVPQWTSHLDLAMVIFCCQLPESVGRMERIFNFKDSSWNLQHFPFQVLFTILHNNWFSKLLFCEWKRRVQPKCSWGKWQRFKVLSRLFQTFFILSSASADLSFTAFPCKFIILSHSVYSPPASPSLLWSLKKPLVCLYFSSNL